MKKSGLKMPLWYYKNQAAHRSDKTFPVKKTGYLHKEKFISSWHDI